MAILGVEFTFDIVLDIFVIVVVVHVEIIWFEAGVSGEFLNKHRLAFKLVLLLLLAFNIDVDADDDDTDKLNFRSKESCVSSLINARVAMNLKSSSLSSSDSLSDETDDDEDEDEEKSSSKLCKYFSLTKRGRSLFCWDE